MIQITRLVVRGDRVIASVSVDPHSRYTDKRRADAIVAAFPQLPLHACVNATGETLGSVLADTSLPHVLEHLVIQLQVSRSTNDDAVFVGTTEWMDAARSKAEVQVSFADDVQALRAFKDAVAFLNNSVLNDSAR